MLLVRGQRGQVSIYSASGQRVESQAIKQPVCTDVIPAFATGIVDIEVPECVVCWRLGQEHLVIDVSRGMIVQVVAEVGRPRTLSSKYYRTFHIIYFHFAAWAAVVQPGRFPYMPAAIAMPLQSPYLAMI